MFSTDTEEEARMLIAMTCRMGYDKKYFAPELAEDQTLENLDAFSDRLAIAWKRLKETK